MGTGVWVSLALFLICLSLMILLSRATVDIRAAIKDQDATCTISFRANSLPITRRTVYDRMRLFYEDGQPVLLTQKRRWGQWGKRNQTDLRIEYGMLQSARMVMRRGLVRLHRWRAFRAAAGNRPRISLFHWDTIMGFNDAMVTALGTGAAYYLQYIVTRRIASHVEMRSPQINVRPDYSGENRFETRIACVFSVRVFHVLMWLWALHAVKIHAKDRKACASRSRT